MAEKLRVLILWSHHSGYLHACLNKLSENSQVLLVAFRASSSAPFTVDTFHNSQYQIIWIDPSDQTPIKYVLPGIKAFSANLCLVSGWNHAFYLQIIHNYLDGRCIKVICFDWQWQPSIKNYCKALLGQLWRHNLFDAAFVPGERQLQFALRAGFRIDRVYQGLYSADPNSYVLKDWSKRSNRVAFVGRLVESKGCIQLSEAWSYVTANFPAASSWRLHVYGCGPFDRYFENLPQCNLEGFTSPSVLAESLAESKILCAPSLYEPWGVQVHEATCAGLAILATHACGSSVHLIADGHNGYLVSSGSVNCLVMALIKLILLEEEPSCVNTAFSRLAEMGLSSIHLSRQFNPVIWAETVENMYIDCTRAASRL